MASRTAWGLDSGVDAVDWRLRALCAENPEWWWQDSEGAVGAARHTCLMHCPVQEHCLADALKHPPCGGVQGGLSWVDKARDRRPSHWQPIAKGCTRCGGPSTIPAYSRIKHVTRLVTLWQVPNG